MGLYMTVTYIWLSIGTSSASLTRNNWYTYMYMKINIYFVHAEKVIKKKIHEMNCNILNFQHPNNEHTFNIRLIDKRKWNLQNVQQ